ncbi:MAG: cytochrome o ubiquinol oxidase subunit III [Candidatus Chaera renei]|uniref:Cytochrome o ubiquinol oxidase subunit III n=1 Tax=Candidatus Chaera renei TaxID=2506947 RepID=A0A4Q0AJ05_9BACT|nr:MAG: cytochrome o ubiquinol oxidase subunit III [Candidatus Chaera renei]
MNRPTSQAINSPVPVFAFWVYLMSDLVLFASLFATYAVLKDNTFGGPSGAQLFNMPLILLATIILLTSSLSAALALQAARLGNQAGTLGWLGLTFFLGAAFLYLEIAEFSKFVGEGHGWQTSGFLTAFFTLVGTHGLHISLGMIWMLLSGVHVLMRGLNRHTALRLGQLVTFWHFLDVVWIFIFTIVYLMGVNQL